MGELRIFFLILLFSFLAWFIRKLWKSPKFDNFCKSFSKGYNFPSTTEEIFDEVEKFDKVINLKKEQLVEKTRRIKKDAERLSKIKIDVRKDVEDVEA